MTPDEIKTKVQGAHRKAMENRSMQMSRGSNIHHLFQGVKLFGREAGTDFVETHLERIVQEAVAMAECKEASLEIPVYSFGRAAIDGMAQALRNHTALKVAANGNTLRLVWAEPNTGYV